ncbi:MAG: glycosyltransferase [Bacteroidetes bacterium]|nr:glycosyltransferase [Bacteroidota bacterium]
MKILFVANRVPFPPYRGDKLKIFNLASKLGADHEIHLITIAETKEDLTYKLELEKKFHHVKLFYLPKWKSYLRVLRTLFSGVPLQVGYFKSPDFQKILHQYLQENKFDAIHVQHLRMSQFIEDPHKLNAILDLPDAFSLYWKRRSENAGKLWMRKFAAMEYKRLLAYEKYQLNRFPLNLVCSKEDCEYLIQSTDANVQVLPNGVDTNLFQPNSGILPIPGRILFTGNMDYEPNVDAVEYFCSEIFPEIKKQVPYAHFVIAGQRPVARVLRLKSESVFITGFVKDMNQEYSLSNVVVAPLRFGAGTQNKVLESMATGVPVVCTKVGFKGLGIQSGEGAILTNSTDAFISEVVKLLLNQQYHSEVSASGRSYVEHYFSWNAIADLLVQYVHQLQSKKGET